MNADAPQTIKILIINSTLERSGITNEIYTICKFIDRIKYDISIITLSTEPGQSRYQDFKDLNIQIYSLESSRLQLIFSASKLKQLVKSINPDVIHTFSYRGSYYASKYFSAYKRVVTLSADVQANYTDTYGRLIGTLLARQELIAFKKATVRSVVSFTLKERYKKYKNIIAVQNGVDHDIYKKVNDEVKSRLRRQLFMKQDLPVFISIGSLIKRKDPLLIIHAFKNSRLSDKAQLIFLGEGPLLDECRKEAANLVNVVFAGNVFNVVEYLQASDYFISASHSEGLPNTVIEAAFCGTGCILSDIPQHREIFKDEKNDATYFKTGQADGLTSILNNYTMVQKNPDCHLTGNKMASETAGLYEIALTT